MEVQTLLVNVYSESIKSWFSERHMWTKEKEKIFSEIFETEVLVEKGFYIEEAGYFLLPPEKLIILGLKHTGLLHCPGFKGYRVEKWSDRHCIILVELDVIYDELGLEGNEDTSHYVPFLDDGYSQQERGVMGKIQKFFYPIAYVVTWDRMKMTGFPSD